MERAEEGAAVKEEIEVALGGSERDEESDEESDRCTCKSMRCKLSDTCNHYTSVHAYTCTGLRQTGRPIHQASAHAKKHGLNSRQNPLNKLQA